MSRETTRAARAGRALLEHAAPPFVSAWVARLAARAGELNPPRSADEVFALAGALAGINAALQAAYAASGSRVRDLIWRLHAELRPAAASRLPSATDEPADKPDPAAERAWAAMAPCLAWLGQRARGDGDDARRWRAVLMRWIDAVNERLTQTHYHRPEQRAAHARALIQGPLSLIAPAAAGLDARWAEALLRAWDLTQADAQAERGVNRVAPPGGGLGGFYGLTESRRAPTAEQTAAALEALIGELAGVSLSGPRGAIPAQLIPLWDDWRAEMRTAAAARLAEGRWPAALLAPAPGGVFRKGLADRVRGLFRRG